MPLLSAPSVTLQNAATTTGNGTRIDTLGYSCIALRVTAAAGLTSATVQFEGSQDGTNYDNVQAVRADNGVIAGSFSPAASDDVLFFADCFGLTSFRARISAIVVGTGSVTVSASYIPNAAFTFATMVQGLAASDAAELGNPVPMGISVDDTTPAVADEGDIRRVRGSSRGELYVRLSVDGDKVDTDLGGVGGLTLATRMLRVGARDIKSDGTNFQFMRTPSTFKMIDAVAIVAATGATVWTPGAGKKFRLMGWYLSSSAAAALEFHDNVIGTIILQTPLLAAAGIHNSTGELGNGFVSATADNVLKLDVTANSTISGMVWGVEE